MEPVDVEAEEFEPLAELGRSVGVPLFETVG